MRPAHLSRLRIPGGALEDLISLHAEWALGLDRFAKLRAQRLAAGMPESHDLAAVIGDAGTDWSFKFSIPVGGLMRTSAIKITQARDVVTVDHLVVREGAPSRLTAPSAESPEVVHWILDNAPTVDPHVLAHPQATLVTEPEVVALLDRAFAADRTVPMVVVAVENASRSPLVDAGELARRLAGMATVHRLASVRESYRLRDELTLRGINERLGCYNGGVRILWPGVGPTDNPYDHLLLLPDRVLAMPTATRTEQVAGVFCELVAESEDLRRLIREVEAPPRPREVAPPEPARPIALHIPETAPITIDEIPALAEITDPEPVAEPPPVIVIASTPRSTWTALADEIVAGLQLANEQEAELDGMRTELAAVRRELRHAEQQRDEIKGSLGPPKTVTGALVRAEALFSDRLIVLRSARASAEDSPYRDAPRVFFVLALLASCDTAGIGDVIQKALGGQARWKPKDSPETVKTFGRERAWTDSTGTPKLFGRHITLGHGISPQKCLQIYYDVLADGRIEVGWCGEHRPTVGEDT